MNILATYCIGIQDLSPWMRSGLLVRSLQRTGDFETLSKDARCSMGSPLVDHFPWGNRGFSHAFPHESIEFDGETKPPELLGSWVVTKTWLRSLEHQGLWAPRLMILTYSELAWLLHTLLCVTIPTPPGEPQWCNRLWSIPKKPTLLEWFWVRSEAWPSLMSNSRAFLANILGIYINPDLMDGFRFAPKDGRWVMMSQLQHIFATVLLVQTGSPNGITFFKGPLPWPVSQEMLQAHQLRSHRGFQLWLQYRAQLHGKAGLSSEHGQGKFGTSTWKMEKYLGKL